MAHPLLPFMINTEIVPSGEIRENPISPGFATLSAISAAASAWHGYKRNRSVGWALAWAASGALLPIVVPVIAVAQGFGKPAQ